MYVIVMTNIPGVGGYSVYIYLGLVTTICS